MADQRFTVTMPPGIVKNDSAYAVKGRYINSNFVRSWEGKMQKWLGWGNYLSMVLTEPARGGLLYTAYDGTAVTAFGTANKLWVIIQGVLYDITPKNLSAGLVDSTYTDTGYGAGGYGAGPYGGGFSSVAGEGSFARVWTIERWGQDMMACPRGGPIYFWSYSGGVGWAKTGTCGNGATVVTLNNVTSLAVGMRVLGTNIAANTFISSINGGASQITLDTPTSGVLSSTPLTFNTVGVLLSSLTADPALPTSALGIFVTDDRSLVAYGAAVSPNTYDALNFAWCNREDYLTWTAGPTNTAGAIRCERGTKLMGVVRIFGGWLALTDQSAHPFTYVGGDNIYSLNRIGSSNCGAIGPQAMLEIDGVAYWMSYENFFSYNGKVQILPSDVHEAAFKNINKLQSYKIHGCTNRRYNEALWFVPGSTTSLENDSYVGMNASDSTWQVGGLMSGGDAIARSTWLDSSSVWRNPIAVDPGTYKIYLHETGTTADGFPINYLLETGELELRDNQGTIQASDRFWRLKKAVPDYAYLSGTHNLTIEARGYPNDAAVNKGPYSINLNVNGGMFNPKARYRSARFLLSGSGDFRIGDWEVYAAPDGGRR